MRVMFSVLASLLALGMLPLATASVAPTAEERQALDQLRPTAQQLEQSAKLLQSPAEEQSALAQGEQSIAELDAELLLWNERMDALIAQLPPVEQGELPPSNAQAGETVVECSRGLYFDTASFQLCYLGDVRLRDSLLHLDCEGLFIQLTQQSVDKKVEEVNQPLIKPGNTQIAPPTEEKKPSVAPASSPPVSVTADEAYINLREEQLLIRSKEIIRIQHPLGELVARGAAPSAILSEKLGIFYLRAEEISGHLKIEGQEPYHFQTQGGIFFYLNNKSIRLLRQVQLKQGKQVLSAKGSMLLQLLLEPQSENARDKTGYFASFQRDYKGLESIVAQGGITAQIEQGEEMLLIKGDNLYYHAQTGESLLTGNLCSIGNSQHDIELRENALIRWASNGAIYLAGDRLQGFYTRPRQGEGEAKALRGSFRTEKHLALIPTSGGESLLLAPSGLWAEDEETLLDVKGSLVMHLRGEQKQVEIKQGAMDFRFPAIPLQGSPEITRLRAAGGITLDNKGENSLALRAESLDLNAISGSGYLISAPNEELYINYMGQQLQAQSPDATARITLEDSGNLLIQGKSITAQFRNEGGDYQLQCRDEMMLDKSTHQIRLAGGIDLRMPDARLRSEHAAIITLEPEPQSGQSASGMLANYPHLHYPYKQLREVLLTRGAAIQSSQFSLQCDGGLHAVMATENQKVRPEMAGIARLDAQGRVRFYAKTEQRGKKAQSLFAQGDQLVVNGQSGEKILTGKRIILRDDKNTHLAEGNPARLRLNAQNDATLTGKRQRSYAGDITEQLDKK